MGEEARFAWRWEGFFRQHVDTKYLSSSTYSCLLMVWGCGGMSWVGWVLVGRGARKFGRWRGEEMGDMGDGNVNRHLRERA